ncbi:MAG: hypothetical protein HY735_11450 [Verrucomicrobia bacterium]|nr:hypothetical protein [Verrucomicrobiota bacterium]
MAPLHESGAMEKVVRKYDGFQAADEADDARYREMSGAEKMEILLELIMPEDPDEAVIQRSARVYPLAQPGRG